MNIRTKWKTYLSILLIFFVENVFSQKISIEEAVDIALKNNNRIKQYSEKVEQKEYANFEAFGNFLPKVNLVGSYTHLNNPVKIDLSPIRAVILNVQAKNQTEFANIYSVLQGLPQLTDQQRSGLFQQYYNQLNSAIPSFVETVKKQDYNTATIVGVQPLFMGGKLLAAKNYADEELKAANIELTKIKNEIIQETVTNYLNVVLLSEVVKTRKDVLEGIKKHEFRAQRLFDEGLIANFNLLRAKVAVADAERNLDDDSNKLELCYIALKNSMGIDETAEIIIEDSLIISNNLSPISNYLESAFENQPLLKLISVKKEQANEKFNLERSKFLPQVAAFGKYELYPEYLSMLEPRWAVGVQLSFNLFNGLQDYVNLQSANHLEKEVQFLEADVRSKIILSINKTYRDIENARNKFIKTSSTIELAEENLRLNNKRFETGLGTSLEVIDAQLILEKNKLESKSSLYDYYKGLIELYVISGIPQEFINVWNKKEVK